LTLLNATRLLPSILLAATAPFCAGLSAQIVLADPTTSNIAGDIVVQHPRGTGVEIRPLFRTYDNGATGQVQFNPGILWDLDRWMYTLLDLFERANSSDAGHDAWAYSSGYEILLMIYDGAPCPNKSNYELMGHGFVRGRISAEINNGNGTAGVYGGGRARIQYADVDVDVQEEKVIALEVVGSSAPVTGGFSYHGFSGSTTLSWTGSASGGRSLTLLKDEMGPWKETTTATVRHYAQGSYDYSVSTGSLGGNASVKVQCEVGVRSFIRIRPISGPGGCNHQDQPPVGGGGGDLID
jgi:hypothetical protein